MRSSDDAIIGGFMKKKNAVCHIGASLCAYRVTVTKRKWDEEIAVEEGTNRTKDKPEYMFNSLPTFTN